jgi:hypothetical protein
MSKRILEDKETPETKKTKLDPFLDSENGVEALNLTKLKLEDLRLLCKERKIAYSGYRKPQLIERLLNLKNPTESPMKKQNSTFDPIPESDEENEKKPKIEKSKNFIKDLKTAVEDLENVIGIDFGATHIIITRIQEERPTVITTSSDTHSNVIKTKFYLQNKGKDYEVVFCPTNPPNPGYDLIMRIKQKIGFGLLGLSDYKESGSQNNSRIIFANVNGTTEKVKAEYVYKKMMESILKDLSSRNLFNSQTKFLLSCPNQYSVKQSQFTFPKMFMESARNIEPKWKGDCVVFNESSCAISQSIISNKEVKDSLLIDIGDSSINLSSIVVENNKIKMYHSGSLIHGGFSITKEIYNHIVKKSAAKNIQNQEKMIIEGRIDEWKPNICDIDYTESVFIDNFFKDVPNVKKKEKQTIDSKTVREISLPVFKKVESLIAEHFETYKIKIPQHVIYCGGGMNNKSLAQFLENGIFKGKNISKQNTTHMVGVGLFYRYALENMKHKTYQFEDYPPFSIYTLLNGVSPNTGKPSRFLRKILGKNERSHKTKGEFFDIEPYTFFPLIQVDSVEELIFEDEYTNIGVIYFGEVSFSGITGKSLNIEFETEWNQSQLKFSVICEKKSYPGSFSMDEVTEEYTLFKNFKLK